MDLNESFQILQSMIQALSKSPDGISTGDFVRQLGIRPRTVQKYCDILSSAGIPIYYDQRKWHLSEDYFTSFKLTAEESEFLFLALERTLTDHSGHWNIVRKLLYKLSQQMPDDLSGQLTNHFYIERPAQPGDRWFTLLAQAKRNLREVLIEYHPLNRPYTSHWHFRPIRFASNALSDGLYVIGQGTQDEIRYQPLSLKFDRILNVLPTDKRFQIADVAQVVENIQYSWGVWHSDKEPVEVVLRFELRHYDRLLESIWHPTQEIYVDERDNIQFSVRVSEPDEMVPWIRSWGSGVVVVEPTELRQRIIRSLQRQTQAYGLNSSLIQSNNNHLSLLWAKYDRTTVSYHQLIYHLIDVSAVGYKMWETVLSDSQKNWLRSLFAVEDGQVCDLLALFAGLHDIGKATPTFQGKADALYSKLVDSGIKHERLYDVPHGVHSAVILSKYLPELGLSRRLAWQLSAVIGGHHGQWITKTQLQREKTTIGGDQWQAMQQSIFQTLVELFGIKHVTFPEDNKTQNILASFLSGFVSVCDWIGSNTVYFPYEVSDIKIEHYFDTALKRAEIALAELGWFGWSPRRTERSFVELFSFPPNSFQQKAIDYIPHSEKPPKLVLIEYLTGGGKTEFTLYLADLLISHFDLSGMYIAMPSQATSNQMFGRVREYLTTSYPRQSINTQLIHAQADTHPFYKMNQGISEREGNDSGPVAEAWFQNRKRALLAPFAVGTIDQAMLSVLQAKHHFVRHYALSHKVVIFDEIHAYDTYMNVIIDQLVSWLSALHSPMILLSATLSEPDRKRLIAQTGADPEIDAIPYPRMIVVTDDNQVQCHALPKPEAIQIQLKWIGASVEDLVSIVVRAYKDGGCIAIVCNTVNEAISVAQMLSQYIAENDLILFHARFPPIWRSQIEDDVLLKFGKKGQRPERAVLVATQIIEQSLDLDFDLMITNLAPIDLLIQRVGRLHRHAINSANRPQSLQTPMLIIRSPQFNDTVPDFDVDELIYERYILLKTWLLLQERITLNIPDDVDIFMGFVYTDDFVEQISEEYQNELKKAHEDMTLGEAGNIFRGKKYALGYPDDDSLIGSVGHDLSDDDRLNIRTRDIRPGIDIICTGNLNSLPHIPDRKPTRNEVSIFLQYRLTIRNKSVKVAIENLPINPYWQRIPELRDARVIMFVDGIAQIPASSYQLSLTPNWGLEILEDEL